MFNKKGETQLAQINIAKFVILGSEVDGNTIE